VALLTSPASENVPDHFVTETIEELGILLYMTRESIDHSLRNNVPHLVAWVEDIQVTIEFATLTICLSFSN
jgi:hypothetical protein